MNEAPAAWPKVGWEPMNEAPAAWPRVGWEPMSEAPAAWPRASAPSGLGVRHMPQATLRAKTRSPQFGQIQSPGCVPMRSVFEPRLSPHLLHLSLAEKLMLPHAGQAQSPGFAVAGPASPAPSAPD